MKTEEALDAIEDEQSTEDEVHNTDRPCIAKCPEKKKRKEQKTQKKTSKIQAKNMPNASLMHYPNSYCSMPNAKLCNAKCLS